MGLKEKKKLQDGGKVTHQNIGHYLKEYARGEHRVVHSTKKEVNKDQKQAFNAVKRAAGQENAAMGEWTVLAIIGAIAGLVLVL